MRALPPLREVCPECHVGLLNRQGQCNECYYPEDHEDPHPRICGSPRSEECGHLVLHIVDDFLDACHGFECIDLCELTLSSLLDNELQCSDEAGFSYDSAEWTEEQLQDAFGRARPLLEAYEGDFYSFPCFVEFFEIASQLLQTPVRMTVWLGPGRCGGVAVLLWSEEPDRAWDEIVALVERVREGFRRLATLPPATRQENASGSQHEDAGGAHEVERGRAHGRIRTDGLLITSELLYR